MLSLYDINRRHYIGFDRNGTALYSARPLYIRGTRQTLLKLLRHNRIKEDGIFIISNGNTRNLCSAK
jgi:hypothetical protein